MFARRADVLEREAERLGAVAVTGDVTSAGDAERLVRTAVDRFGGIDVLVNNSSGPRRRGHRGSGSTAPRVRRPPDEPLPFPLAPKPVRADPEHHLVVGSRADRQPCAL